MEEYLFINKSIIPFLKKINKLLFSSYIDQTQYGEPNMNIINLLFHIYYINIIYYNNINLGLKLSEKTRLLYNELIKIRYLRKENNETLIPSINDINNYIYEKTLSSITINNIHNRYDYFHIYMNVLKIIYIYIFDYIILNNNNNFLLEKINKNILYINKYLLYIYKNINNNIYIDDFNNISNILIIICNNIFTIHNLNLITKMNILLCYLEIIDEKIKNNYDFNTIKKKLLSSLLLNDFTSINNIDKIDIDIKEKQFIFNNINFNNNL